MKCRICRTCCSKIDFRNKDVIIKKNCCRDLPIDIDRLKAVPVFNVSGINIKLLITAPKRNGLISLGGHTTTEKLKPPEHPTTYFLQSFSEFQTS